MYAGLRLLLVTALLTTASPLLAGIREGAITLSPFFGGQGFPNGSEHFDADLKWGVRGGYNITRNFGAEIVFGANSTKHDPEEVPCMVYQYGADLLYLFRPGTDLVPFAAAGFGGFAVDYDSMLPDETSAYFNYGGGIQYSLGAQLALRVDFRHALTLNNADHALEGTVGLGFQFGGR